MTTTVATKLSPLAGRWKAMPRAMRWGALALVGIGVYFVAVEPALGAMSRWNSRADTKQTALTKFENERSTRKNKDAAAALGVSRFGIVEPPGEAGERSEALNRKVAKVLEDNGIKRPTTTTREVPVTAGSSALVRHLGSEYSIQRLINDIAFDAEPEQISKVVTQLEQSPEISSVSKVQIRQIAGDTGGRLVRATLAVEAWQYKKKARSK